MFWDGSFYDLPVRVPGYWVGILVGMVDRWVGEWVDVVQGWDYGKFAWCFFGRGWRGGMTMFRDILKQGGWVLCFFEN